MTSSLMGEASMRSTAPGLKTPWVTPAKISLAPWARIASAAWHRVRAVVTHRQGAVGAGDRDQIGDQLGRDRGAGLILAVLACVAEVGHHRRDAARRGALGRVQHDEQLHEVLGRGAGGLDDEHVAAADVLVDPHRHLAVLEALDFGVAERRLELLADGARERAAGVPTEDAARIQVTFSRGYASCADEARRTPAGAPRPGPGEPAELGLAGAGGLEPPVPRSKVSCLTIGPRPTNRTGFPSRSARARSLPGEPPGASGVM